MKGILGRKIGMTSVFAKNGTLIPVTVIEVEPNIVSQIKTKEKDRSKDKTDSYGKSCYFMYALCVLYAPILRNKHRRAGAYANNQHIQKPAPLPCHTNSRKSHIPKLSHHKSVNKHKGAC